MSISYDALRLQLLANGKFSKNFQRPKHSLLNQIEDYLFAEILEGCEHDRFIKTGELFEINFDYTHLLILTLHKHGSTRVMSFKGIQKEVYDQLVCDLQVLEQTYPISVHIPPYSYRSTKKLMLYAKEDIG